MVYLIFLLAIFFTVNMGGASFAASFATAFGSKLLNRQQSALLFLIFVIIGALTFGAKVSVTLGKGIVDPTLIGKPVLFIILFAAGLSMFIANVMKIPQTTSIVTVASISGAGAFLQSVNVDTILFMLPFWILLPAISFGLTQMIAGFIYPPRKVNFWIYQKFINQESKLKIFVIIASCYSAFSVGTNNVANVVGPLMTNYPVNIKLLLLVFALLYGLGAFIFSGPIKTAGNKFVPLGLLTASIISVVSGSLMIFASWVGIPQSFVMLQMGAILAIASLKDGHAQTFSSPLTMKVFYTWTINPLLTFVLSYGLCFLFVKHF